MNFCDGLNKLKDEIQRQQGERNLPAEANENAGLPGEIEREIDVLKQSQSRRPPA